jgi:phosphate:Na+ symporter
MIPENAYAIVLGANIGTTSTSLLVSTRMGKVARVTAVANFLFNSVGVLLFLPVLGYISKLDSIWVDDPAQQVAFFHLIFNLVTAVFFLLFLRPFYLGLIKLFKLKDFIR